MNAKNVNYYDSSALEASVVIKASPGTLFSITGHNNKAAAQFIQLHDAAALPADTAVPKIVLQASANENFHYELKEIGRYFKVGIVVCNSSTLAQKTLGGNDCFFNAQYD
ncbi:hypothetical protein KA005_69145 [bacterium]|nr:hypothetical protein [bacterium]